MSLQSFFTHMTVVKERLVSVSVDVSFSFRGHLESAVIDSVNLGAPF